LADPVIICTTFGLFCHNLLENKKIISFTLEATVYLETKKTVKILEQNDLRGL